jgi:hypothetical protein
MLNVPEPIAAYVAAEQAKDAEKLSLCFIEDGTVNDEGRDYRDWKTIRRWKQEADEYRVRFVRVKCVQRRWSNSSVGKSFIIFTYFMSGRSAAW